MKRGGTLQFWFKTVKITGILHEINILFLRAEFPSHSYRSKAKKLEYSLLTFPNLLYEYCSFMDGPTSQVISFCEVLQTSSALQSVISRLDVAVLVKIRTVQTDCGEFIAYLNLLMFYLVTYKFKYASFWVIKMFCCHSM
jgi:hypothetical protein